MYYSRKNGNCLSEFKNPNRRKKERIVSILVKLMKVREREERVAGCKTIRMGKLVEVRLQKPSSQGRERLRVELFKDWPVRSTMRVKTATKVEYARDGRGKRKERGKSKDARAGLRLIDVTQMYRHPGGPPTEGFGLTRHLGEEP